jgi:Tfp pilus assembly protein PilX
MMRRIILCGQKGAALIVALVLLLILTILGIMALDASLYEVSIVGNQKVYNAAFYAAEGGFDEFRSNPPLGHPNDHVPFSSPKPVGTSGNTCRYKWDRIGTRDDGGISYEIFKVTAEGTAPNFPNTGRVTIEAVIEIEAGGTQIPAPPVAKARIRSWREVTKAN